MLRKATKLDLNDVLDIATQAIAFLKTCGVDQWQDGYPNEETFREDIAKEQLYVLEKGNEIVAITVIQTEPEATYTTIDGQWVTDGSYATVHRCAVKAHYRGQHIGLELFLAIEQYVKQRGMVSVRIDTHEDNRVMQKLLEKQGYCYCGMIYLERQMANNKRLAYEKKIY